MLNTFENLAQNVKETKGFYDVYNNYLNNAGKSIFIGSLSFVVFMKFALEVRIRLEAKVKKLFRRVFPKIMENLNY